MPPIGKIARVPIREVWPREDEDFTPWLAQNLDQLGDALGMVLDQAEGEAPVGRFSLDILGSVDFCICNRCAGPFHVIPSAGKH